LSLLNVAVFPVSPVAKVAPHGAAASAIKTALSESSALVSGIGRPFDSLTLRTGDIAGLVSFVPEDDVKFNEFSVTDAPHCLLWVVLDDGGLVNENVFFCVVTVDEAITRLDVEPFYCASDLFCHVLLRVFCFSVGHGSVGLLR